MIEPSRTSRKAKANPVNPIRMRWALLLAWLAILVVEAMSRFDDMQARALDG